MPSRAHSQQYTESRTLPCKGLPVSQFCPSCMFEQTAARCRGAGSLARMGVDADCTLRQLASRSELLSRSDEVEARVGGGAPSAPGRQRTPSLALAHSPAQPHAQERPSTDMRPPILLLKRLHIHKTVRTPIPASTHVQEQMHRHFCFSSIARCVAFDSALYPGLCQ
eukprot:535933-Pleurochrysis_carterae.AAC.1